MMKKRIAFVAAAGAAFCLASAASADLAIEITTVNNETGYTEVVEFFNHEFGTSESMDAFGNRDGTFVIHATSGVSSLDGWDYQLELDYSDYDIGFFGMAGTTEAIIDLNNPAYADVVDATVLDGNNAPIGALSFSDNTITWDAPGLSLQMGGEVATVHWNTVVPTPGALALLGMAGLVGVSRRRTCR